MPELLIIYPHWHPANLAGVHRPRLTGNYLPEFGWKVHVLTVEEAYFEESPDPDFEKTFREEVFNMYRVKAKKISRPRLIGDIGLRAYPFLKRKALQIISEEHIDFIWIPIPSFYTALIGPWLYRRTGVPFGIDYIDPWVRDISNQKNLRSILSQRVARILEPKAVKQASLITGVSRNYYLPVLIRNGLLNRKPYPIVDAAFPYGFDISDHEIRIEDVKYPWTDANRKIWLYTGAFLPNSHYFMDLLFKACSELQEDHPEIRDVLFCFLGTGPYPAKGITAYAEDYGVADQVLEIRERFPFLQTLNFQSAADTIMIIGSTEKHYTASKTYQSLLSKRPVFSILHKDSQAVEVLKECRADAFTVRFADTMSNEDFLNLIKENIAARLRNDSWKPDLSKLNKYSARESARALANAMEKAIEANA